MSPPIDNADLIKFYFDKSKTESNTYYCRNAKCMSIRGKVPKGYKQEKNKGFTNLRNHLRSCVGPDFEETYLKNLRDAGGCMDNFCFNSKRDNDVFKIIQWVIMRNQPLTEVDDPLTRDLFHVSHISSKTLRNYILSLVPVVEENVRRELPNKFCLMIDGWSDNHVHYVAIFCTYIKDGNYCETLIACSPLLKEDDLGANQHFEFIVESLSVYGRGLCDVICIVGDNCKVNQKLAEICGVALVGCNSHKFNLSVERWICEQIGLLEAMKVIRELMSQLRTLKLAARLREITHLGALLPNETRWTGKCDMIERYFKIEEYIQGIPELDQYLPTPVMRRRLLAALDDLKNSEVYRSLCRRKE